MAFALTAKAAPNTPIVPRHNLGNAVAVADLPAAASFAGYIIPCTNGDAGASCLVVSDGVGWFKIVVGAAAAAT